MATGTTTNGARWLIYGANGYTGRLIAEEAKRRGMTPILAGRNREALASLGSELALETRCFDLGSADAIGSQLRDVDLVLHCAGPFSATARPMLEACARSGSHYLDITGEIEVFEHVHANGAKWSDCGIVAMPGVGFDVVPSDCLAAMLKARMPAAVRLRLAFKPIHGKLSPGTTKTVIEGIPRGGMIRRGGKLVKVGAAHKVIRVPFDGAPEQAVAIPWGDVSTAFHSTGIPNIEVFIGLPPAMIWQMRATSPLGRFLGAAPIQRFLKGQVTRRLTGPNEAERASSSVVLWGEVRDSNGAKLTMTLRTPETYQFTVIAAVACVERVLAGDVKSGAQTPSRALGAEFVLSLPGVTATQPA